MIRKVLTITALTILVTGLFFLVQKSNHYEFQYSGNADVEAEVLAVDLEAKAKEVLLKETSANKDLPNQKPLQNPSAIIKAVYATSWSAASPSKINYLIDLIKKTELNAIVIDLKDYSGAVTYDSKAPDAIKYKAVEVRIPKINTLLKRLHDENIYVIGRIAVFQDPILTKARPDLAVKNITNGAVWKDNKGLPWIDPGAKDAWDYIIAIAKDASERGFDEINFDYIRFPSDGDLSITDYPSSDMAYDLKSTVIRRFFSYLRENTRGIKISADLFGLTTDSADDLGIGQIIEDAYENFDYVAPMVYPSHYASGFMNFKNPAKYPYEVISESMKNAVNRLIAFNKKSVTDSSGQVSPASPDERASRGGNVNGQVSHAKLRPWLQDFDLGANYDEHKVRAEIKAVEEVFGCADSPPSPEAAADAQICKASAGGFSDKFGGWMLWDPRNNYTKAALSTVNN